MSIENPRFNSQLILSAQVVIACPEFSESLAFYTEQLGFRVDMIFPADAPSTAVVTGYGLQLRLESNAVANAPTIFLTCDAVMFASSAIKQYRAPEGTKIVLIAAIASITMPDVVSEFSVSMHQDNDAWSTGRAGMQYRDLIPSRLGGRFIASHIRIPDGGEVPDYVHYHNVRFQMIFCKSGWARVVYEDQGAAFLLHAGDLVLQPPGIRHRVLEASKGLEVIEMGSPAIHETFADHSITLPTQHLKVDRCFGCQRFVRHIAETAIWQPWIASGFQARDSGIAAATHGLAEVRVIKTNTNSQQNSTQNTVLKHDGELLFLCVLDGEMRLSSEVYGTHLLC